MIVTFNRINISHEDVPMVMMIIIVIILIVRNYGSDAYVDRLHALFTFNVM